MYFHVIGFSRGLLASLLVLIVALPQNVFAQAPHLVTPAELHRELLTAARMREQNRQTLRQFPSSEAGKTRSELPIVILSKSREQLRL